MRRAVSILFSAELVSRLGDAVTGVALPLTAISWLHVGALELAAIGVAQAIPVLALSLPLGAWADHRPRRAPLVVAADLVRGLLVATIPLSAMTGLLSVPVLLVVAFLASAAGTLFEVGFAGWIPRLLEGDSLHRLNARVEVARSTALVSGPAIGGALVSLLGAPMAIAADALSFLASGGLLFTMARSEPLATPAERLPLRQELVTGLRFVASQPVIRAIIATATINNLSRSIAMGIALLYLVSEAGLTPIAVGTAIAVGNTGFVLGALIARPLTRRLGVGRSMQLAVGLFGPPMLLFAVAPLSLAAPTFVLMLLTNSLGIAVHNVNQVTLRQVLTPDALRGRVSAVTRLTIFGATPVGMAVGGVVGQAVSLRGALILAAIGLLAGNLPYLKSRIGSIRTIDGLGLAGPRPSTG